MVAEKIPHVKTKPKGRLPRGTKRLEDFTLKEKEILTHPGNFAVGVLNQTQLYPKQIEILNQFFDDGARVSVRTCNESGKTSLLITLLILWHMLMFPRKGIAGGCISTSGSWNQVVNQLVPSLRAFSKHPLFAGYEFNQASIVLNGIPQWVGFATRDAGRAEGFHGDPENPLLAIIDEAKSVPDDNISTIEDRCNPQRFGMFSSPGYAQGQFYLSHSKLQNMYLTHKVTAAECPHISKESIERRIAKWGANHPLIKSMIDAEFMEMVQGAPISLVDIERCLENPPKWNQVPERHAFIDFAAGGDETVLAYRHGNRVTIEDAWVDKDTGATCARLIGHLVRLKCRDGLDASEVEGDASGLGKPMILRMHELGWPIGFAYNQEAPRFDKHFYNLASENWYQLCDQIKRRDIIIPDDMEFRAQLMNRANHQPPDTKGRLWIETKDEMSKASRDGGATCSPDRAEAVAGAAAPSRRRQPTSLTKVYAHAFEEAQFDENILQGAFAGY